MKIQFVASGEKFSVDFKITPATGGNNTHFIAMATNSKELDKLKNYISKRGAGDASVGDVIANVVSKKLGIPIEKSYRYEGAGFGLTIDIFSLVKKIN